VQDALPGVVLERLLQAGPAHIAESLVGLKASLAEQARAERDCLSLASGNPSQGLNAPAVRGWSWAAFLGGGPWALAHRMVLLGVVLLLAFWTFPLPNLLLGRFGGQMAWRQRPFSGLDQFQAVERTWARVGVLVVLAQLAGMAALLWWLLRA
jgi:hypothetical protein